MSGNERLQDDIRIAQGQRLERQAVRKVALDDPQAGERPQEK